MLSLVDIRGAVQLLADGCLRTPCPWSGGAGRGCPARHDIAAHSGAAVDGP